MKYLLSFTLVLFLSLHASAQRSVDFRVGLQTSKFDQLNLNGISLGVIHKSEWLIQYDLESRNQKPENLPNSYNGNDLRETFMVHSFSIGKALPLFETESLRLVTKIGLHTGRYTGYDNFVKLPVEDDLSLAEALGSGLGAIILVPIALTDHLDNQSHSYDPVKENLNGLNGEILFEYKFPKYLVLSAGGKWIKNQRMNDFGYTVKIGVQF